MSRCAAATRPRCGPQRHVAPAAAVLRLWAPHCRWAPHEPRGREPSGGRSTARREWFCPGLAGGRWLWSGLQWRGERKGIVEGMESCWRELQSRTVRKRVWGSERPGAVRKWLIVRGADGRDRARETTAAPPLGRWRK